MIEPATVGRVLPPAWKQRDRVNAWAFYAAGNELGFPMLAAETYVPERLVAFHDTPSYGPDAAVHFYIDDYRFEKLFDRPDRYLERLEGAAAVLTPDFSVFADWPLAMQIWQVYRSRWLGAHLRSLGFRVIPSVSWALPADLFFEALPRRSVLAVATTGIRRRPDRLDGFRAGFDRLAELDPITVLVYGGLDGLDIEPSFPVTEYPSFLDDRRAIMEGRERDGR